MELYNDEVPASEVWAVMTENPDIGQVIEWFITPQESSEAYRFITAWYDLNKDDLEVDTKVTRWYVELPRRRMERLDVDLHVEGTLTETEGMIYASRLDVHVFHARQEQTST